MEQRDYLLRQIELMAQTLTNLIRRLLGLKEINEEEAEQATDEMLKENLNISIAEILNTPIDKLVDLILSKESIHVTNIDLFAEILVINAKASGDLQRKRKLLERAQTLYNWLDKKSGTFSIERHQKMNEIENYLGEEAE
jgi:hypothetical protein